MEHVSRPLLAELLRLLHTCRELNPLLEEYLIECDPGIDAELAIAAFGAAFRAAQAAVNN